MKKVLIIDYQVIHTKAIHRGIGKYSYELLECLLTTNRSSKEWDEVQIIISSKLDIDPDAKEMIKHFAKNAEIVMLPLDRDLIYDTAKVVKANRDVIDSHVSMLTTSYQINFLILAALQGGVCTVFPSLKGIKKSVICYDLIPFMFHNTYYANHVGRRENLSKLDEFLKADTFLTISKTVANDLAIHLGVGKSRIFDIDGGPINHGLTSKPLETGKKFILMPTGDDPRKNNLVGIKGFKEFNARSNNSYSLVITSFFNDQEIKELKEICPNLIFTGNIDGNKLKYLYQNCQIVLFPSYYEGLGLPVLEAVESYRPVACSDISVFREISTTAFTFFDYTSPSSITRALAECINKEISKSEYSNILNKYNWQQTVKLMTEALNKTVSCNPSLRATIYTANPENRGMPAKLIQRSHAELSRHLELNYLIDNLQPSTDSIAPNLFAYMGTSKVLSLASAVKPLIQPVIYDLDNNEQYARILFTALANPGILLLNNLDLSLVWEAMLKQHLISQSRYELEQKIQTTLKDTNTKMIGSLIAHQKAVVVFSNDNKKQIDKLKELLNQNFLTEAINYPVGQLVYQDIMPPSIPTVIEVDESDTIHIMNTKSSRDGEKRNIKYSNSFEYEKELSSSSFVMVGEPMIYQVLEAFKYGLLPVSTDPKIYDNYGSILAPIVKQSSEMLFEAKNIKAAELKRYSKLVQNQLAENNSYRLFTQKLSDIVSKVGEE